VIPTTNARGYLIGEPTDVVRATKDDVSGWLGDAREGILDALCDLFLVVNFLQLKNIGQDAHPHRMQ
jgi:hypothetical protein